MVILRLTLLLVFSGCGLILGIDDPMRADGDMDGSVDGSLDDLQVSSGALVPPFDPAVTEYVLDLTLRAEDLTITPIARGAVEIEIAGDSVASGVASAPIALNLGDNSIDVAVTIDGGDPVNYRIVAGRGEALALEAYVKASNTEADDRFGGGNDTESGSGFLAISGDTMVVSAPREDSNSQTINGDQASNGRADSGAVYVFVREATGWVQQAYIKSPNGDPGDLFGGHTLGSPRGPAVAISGDTLVVGAAEEDANATGVGVPSLSNAAQNSGAVYVYNRTGTLWTEQAYIKPLNTGAGDNFGVSVAISGDTLVVGAPREDSALGADPADDNASNAGAVYVFFRSGTSWTQQAYLKPTVVGAGDEFGQCVAIDGDTVAIGAQREDSSALNDPNNDGLSSSGAAYVFFRTAGVWSQQAYLKASNLGNLDLFGCGLGLSGDTVVVAAIAEDSSALGIDGDQLNDAAPSSGAAYVFDRTGSSWAQTAYIKSSNSESGDAFGSSVALSGDGLVIGAPGESSSAVLVGGDQTDNSVPGGGAAFFFIRRDGVWTQHRYLKSANPGDFDVFGMGVAFTPTGIAVSANGEDSSAIGINSNDNDDASDSGAAFIFE